MGGPNAGPEEYVLKKIAILERQMLQIDTELEGRRKDHERITTAFANAKAMYTAALTDEEALQRLSLGTDYTERVQRMHQIIRGVNNGLFDEIRTYKAFLKSLNAERRLLEREVSLLRLRIEYLGAGTYRDQISER